jgi:hypothetical protein
MLLIITAALIITSEFFPESKYSMFSKRGNDNSWPPIQEQNNDIL